MHVSIAKITLHLPQNNSLKGKRKILRSLISRTKNRFNVAVAEVDHLDQWQLAGIGIVSISNDGSHANRITSHVIEFIQQALSGDVVVIDQSQEIISGL